MNAGRDPAMLCRIIGEMEGLKEDLVGFVTNSKVGLGPERTGRSLGLLMRSH